jgi:hypothetical protein
MATVWVFSGGEVVGKLAETVVVDEPIYGRRRWVLSLRANTTSQASWVSWA